MSRSDATEGAHGGDELSPLIPPVDEPPAADQEAEAEEPKFFEDPKRLAQSGLVVLLLVVGIYVLLPKVIEDQDAGARLGDASVVWIVIAVAFAVAMFGAYVALFKGVVGERVDLRWKDSYDITMAGLAATRLFSGPAPAGSCSPTGRCARPECRARRPPRGWSPSWSFCTPFTWRPC